MTSLPGASPLRPQNKNRRKNLSMKEKQKKHPAPSRWSGQGHAGRTERGKHLLELATKG